ncbi:MAG: hypothetical protein IJW96_00875, partial [Clostridia bacterium]|nr:hypothetical protein [Clostridia bacterium]
MIKISKITAGVVGIVLALIVFTVGCLVGGNPVSYALVWNTANQHIKNEFADTDYKIKSIDHVFPYINTYRAHIYSPTKQDERFTLVMNGLGEITSNNYDVWVTKRYTVKWRLQKEYGDLGEKAFKSLSLTENDRLSFTLHFPEGEGPATDFFLYENHLDAVNLYDLPLNTATCTQEICATSGDIYYLESTSGKPTMEYAAERLLWLKEVADREGFSFYSIHYSLKSTNEAYQEDYVSLPYIYYDDIQEEGLVEHLKE